MNQWRKFQFFEEKSPETGLPEDLRRSVSCSASGRGCISLGTDEGLVHVADRSLRLKLSFLAHSGPVLALSQLRQRNIIISIGEEAIETPAKAAPGPSGSNVSPDTHPTTLKLWDLDKRDAHDSPTCLRTFDVFNHRFPASKVTTAAVLEAPPFNLLIAIGLKSGAVDLLRADSKHITRIRLPPDGDLASCSQADTLLPITGLGFHSDPAGGTQLFTVSEGGVCIFPLSSVSSASLPARQTLAPLGAPLGCVAMTTAQDLVVARPEAFYLYNDEGPGPCYAMECEKQTVGWFREYLVCVHADPRKEERSVLAIYDLKNKLIVHSTVVASPVRHLACDGGALVVLLQEGAPLVLVERHMQWKLQALFRKSLYGLALSLVQASNVDALVVTDVVRKYGDHLYEMRDYDGAVAQYVRTIGQLEPSYVIQKFLSAQRIQNLTLYLEELHRAQAAGPDHTMLLLNCYTRLKDVTKLDAFIRGHLFSGSQGQAASDGAPEPKASPAKADTGAGAGPEGGRHRLSVTSSGDLTGVAQGEGKGRGEGGDEKGAVGFEGEGVSDPGVGKGGISGDITPKLNLPRLRVRESDAASELPFDAETAIKICQTAGCHEQALFIARRAGLHATVLGILLDDLGSFQEGLQYLEKLNLDLKLSGLKQYGHVLVSHCADDMTSMLLELCMTTSRPDASTSSVVTTSGSAEQKIIKEIKVSGGSKGTSPTGPSASSTSSKPPLGRPPIQVKLNPISGGSPKHAAKVPNLATSISPMEFAELYVDQPSALILFLEKFTEKVQDSQWHRETLNALLELYLSFEVVVDMEEGTVAGPNNACAQTDPEGWASQKLRVKEDKERLNQEALEAAALAVGTKGFLGGGPTTGGFIPATPKLFGLPGTGSIGGPSSTPGGSSGLNVPEFDTGSRLWYLAKAGKLLKMGWPQQGGTPRYDPEQASLSCQMHGFRDGLLFLYERMKMFKEVAANYMKEGDLKGLIACCKKLGDPQRGGDPSLWSDVLAFFGEQQQACEAEVREVLDAVDRDELLPPLLVLQALSKNRAITVGVVKDYVARQLHKDTAAIEDDRRAIERYQEETGKQRAELTELETQARVFQVNKCTACSVALDLPALHFLCMHSFHLRCMGDNESECPVCAPTNRTVLAMRKSLEQSANDQDRFFQELHDAKDGFSVIAEYFGRNIMNSKAQEAAEEWTKPLHRRSASVSQPQDP